MIDKHTAIHSLEPTAEFSTLGDEITWISKDIPQPTEIEIQTEILRLQAEYDAKKYQRDRAKVYPPIGDQLDMQYWDKINATSIWSDLITKIKSDNPKE